MAGGSVWSREEAEFRASNGECVGTLLPGALWARGRPRERVNINQRWAGSATVLLGSGRVPWKQDPI